MKIKQWLSEHWGYFVYPSLVLLALAYLYWGATIPKEKTVPSPDDYYNYKYGDQGENNRFGQ